MYKFIIDGSEIVSAEHPKRDGELWIFNDGTLIQSESDYTFTEFEVVDVPQSITRRQAKLALNQVGLLQTVETAIANSADEILKIEWMEAGEFKRDWPNLNTLADSLNITDAQLDELFILGGSL